MPTPGGYSLLLDPTIVTDKEFAATFSRVLINGRSSINILYKDTADKLGIHESQLGRSRTTFHGIVPGLSCTPVGTIRLDVIFGDKSNFRCESIWFEVVDHASPYQPILGRPALAKFMAVPHYGCLKMKLPGPNGIITVAGDYRRSMACASAGSKMAETLAAAEEFKEIKRAIAAEHPEVPAAKKQPGEDQFQAQKDSKRIPLDESKPDDKFLTIGNTLSSK